MKEKGGLAYRKQAGCNSPHVQTRYFGMQLGIFGSTYGESSLFSQLGF
jgi:hypothetical protein